MQRPCGALTQNFRLIKKRYLRGQQSARPVGDGETQVESARCLMSLRGHLVTRRDQSSLLLFHKIHNGAVAIEKDKYLTPDQNIELCTIFVDTRHTVMP